MLQVLAIGTVVVVGVMVGVEFAVAVFVNPILARIPNNGGLAARADGGRVLGRVMPFWYIASLVLSALWGALVWGGPQVGTVLAGAALLLVSVVMSIVLLVPINNRTIRWSTEGVPADWRAQINRWDRYHYVRVAVIIAAFVLLVVSGQGV